MFYVVPRMKLIPQDKNMSCWYASGQMLIQWDRRVRRRTSAKHPDPSQVKRWSKLYDNNPGIGNPQILAFATDLGLEPVPPMSPTPAAIEKWLYDYGPLWVNGKTHITVIAGIRDTNKSWELLVYDPALPHKKHGEWRDIATWYVGDPRSGRDTTNAVEAVFLHLPADSK
jgi:hypothetical protein